VEGKRLSESFLAFTKALSMRSDKYKKKMCESAVGKMEMKGKSQLTGRLVFDSEASFRKDPGIKTRKRECLKEE